MELDEIDATTFVDARSGEIKLLETKISQSTKKTQLLQRLPFHKRRRTKSKDTRKNPKKHKRKNGRKKKVYGFPLLVTHKWFSKRFRMIKMFDSIVPYERTMKSDKFMYKSSSRGFIYDESYKNIKIIDLEKIKDALLSNCQVTFENIERKFIDVIQNISEMINYRIEICLHEQIYFFDVFKTESKLYVIHLSNKCFEGLLGECFFDSLCFSILTVYKGSKLTETGIYDKFHRNYFVSDFFDNKYKEKFLFVKSSDQDFESGKIFVDRRYTMILWQFLIVSGYIPISIKEILRLGTENSKLIYPFDYVNSQYYVDYEKCIVQPVKDKYDRTPKSKKPNYDKLNVKDPFFIPKITNSIQTFYFVVYKGNIKRMAVISNEFDKTIGYVIRGCFCFTIGRNKGVCMLFENTYKKLYAQNINERNKYEIKIEDKQQL